MAAKGAKYLSLIFSPVMGFGTYAKPGFGTYVQQRLETYA